MNTVEGDAVWAVFGCHFAADSRHRVWRFKGSRTGLSVLSHLLMRTAGAGVPSGPFHCDADRRFTIRVWERPGIDDEGVYGPPDALTRLASFIETRLAEVDNETEFRVDTEFAPDAEYSLVLRVTDDLRPISPVGTVGDETERGSTQQLDQLPAFQFHFYDFEDEVESQGLFTLAEDAVYLEFHLKDEDADTPLPVVHEKVLPLEDIASVTFKRGVIGPIVTIHTHTATALGGLPTKQLGRVKLRFKRKDRDEVERMVTVLASLLEQEN